MTDEYVFTAFVCIKTKSYGQISAQLSKYRNIQDNTVLKINN